MVFCVARLIGCDLSKFEGCLRCLTTEGANRSARPGPSSASAIDIASSSEEGQIILPIIRCIIVSIAVLHSTAQFPAAPSYLPNRSPVMRNSVAAIRLVSAAPTNTAVRSAGLLRYADSSSTLSSEIPHNGIPHRQPLFRHRDFAFPYNPKSRRDGASVRRDSFFVSLSISAPLVSAIAWLFLRRSHRRFVA